MENLIPKIEQILDMAKAPSSAMPELTLRQLRTVVSELNAQKPDYAFCDTWLEAAYTSLYKEREEIVNKSTVVPVESDLMFKELSEALELVNDCIELITNEY